MEFKKEQVLMIDYSSLPKKFRVLIYDWLGFSNDCILPLRSEFDPKSLTLEELIKYYNTQIEEKVYNGTFDSFIIDKGLEFEKYLVDQNLDLTGIDKILINICI
jgi:hypothetical protein